MKVTDLDKAPAEDDFFSQLVPVTTEGWFREHGFVLSRGRWVTATVSNVETENPEVKRPT